MLRLRCGQRVGGWLSRLQDCKSSLTRSLLGGSHSVEASVHWMEAYDRRVKDLAALSLRGKAGAPTHKTHSSHNHFLSGVFRDKGGAARWRVQISYKGNRHLSASFATEEEAATLHDKIALAIQEDPVLNPAGWKAESR